MAKKLSKQQVRDYVDLYLWLKKEMKKPEWREFTAYIHGKAGYHDVADTYIKFIKEFESVTRGYVENTKVKSAEELNDAQIAHLANALSNVSPDSDLTRFNLMLGNVYGENAGRYKALMTAMVAEAKVDQLKKELEMAKRAKLDHTTAEILLQISEQYKIINQNIATVNKKVSKLEINPTNIEEKMVDIDEKFNIIMRKLDSMGTPTSGSGSSSGVSSGWRTGAIVAGGLAFLMLGTTFWAGSYHDDLGTAKDDANKANDSAIYWQDQYNQLNNSYAALNAQYQKLQDDYKALLAAPSQEALIKYINKRQELDVMLIVALNDSKITPEEREQLANMAESIVNIDIAISLANPDLGNFISSLLTTMDKFDLAIDTLNARIVELEGLIASTDDKAKIEQLTNEKEQLEKDKQNIIKEYNDYKASHAHSNEDVEKMKADYEAKLKEKSQEAIRLQGIVDDLTEKLANAKTEEEYNALLEKYNQTVAELEIANKDWKDLYDAYETYKVNTNAVIQELRNKVSAQEKTIADQEKKIADQQAIIDAYEAQGPSSGITQAQYDAAVKAKNDAIKAKEAAEKALAEEQKAHNATKKLLDEANGKISSLNSTINNLNTQIANYKANHNYTDAEYEALQNAYDALLDDYDILREQLQNATTPEEMQAILEQLAKYESVANMVYEQFYGTAGSCTPEQLAAILQQFGFNVEQNPGDPSNNIYQPGK